MTVFINDQIRNDHARALLFLMSRAPIQSGDTIRINVPIFYLL